MKTTVTIKGGNPYRSIEVSMEEYIEFIRGQATMLGISEEEEQPISYIGFGDLELTDCENCGMCDGR